MITENLIEEASKIHRFPKTRRDNMTLIVIDLNKQYTYEVLQSATVLEKKQIMPSPFMFFGE